jgi:hypothetical protein
VFLLSDLCFIRVHPWLLFFVMTPFQFDATRYGPAVAALLAEPRLMPLGPGKPVAAVRPHVAALELPAPCLAGMWLYFDFLEESHQISQADESDPDRNFWHAILHRREPDASNSKYWWREVGAHPVLDRLREQAPTLGYAYTLPAAFVDFGERVRDSGSAEEETAKRVQLLEWQLLFDHCYRVAIRSISTRTA